MFGIILGIIRALGFSSSVLLGGSIFLGFGICTSVVSLAQPIPFAYSAPGNRQKLENYYRERLLRIKYRVRIKSTGEIVDEYGTGFLVSQKGFGITARHVFERALDEDNYELTEISIMRADGDRLVPLSLVSGLTELSKKADIALFKVETAGDQPFDKYMCLEFGDLRIDRSSRVTTAAWRFFDDAAYGWRFRFDPDVTVTSDQGPGPLAKYWELNKDFENSMSGGPVVRSGRVVGVIAGSLTVNRAQLPGANYAALLQYADDLNLAHHADHCLSAIPGETSIVRHRSQMEFMLGDQGTLALIPGGIGGEHWAFPRRGNYGLRRSDLPCESDMGCNCSTAGGRVPDRSVRFVINHRTAGTGSSQCENGSLDVYEATYYGVQLVPIFTDASKDTIQEEVWLYRNVGLYERLPNGGFVDTTARSKGDLITRRRTPKEFNRITSEIEEVRAGQVNGCTGQVKPDECLEILRLQYAKGKLGLWHGFPRDRTAPRSTLADPRENWSIPQGWQDQDLQVKNWILRYRGTTSAQSSRPVTFSFCADADWEGFYLRVFSPERCVAGAYVRVFLQD